MPDIALLTFKPDRCPRCRGRFRVHPDDWAAGSSLGCRECGLLVARIDEHHALGINTHMGGDLALVAPYS